eukprot:1215790-Pyramimonas_sp.AAC.2
MNSPPAGPTHLAGGVGGDDVDALGGADARQLSAPRDLEVLRHGQVAHAPPDADNTHVNTTTSVEDSRR